MTQRAVKSVQPFEFRSDFTLAPEPEQPAPPTEGQLTLTGPELAHLLSEARSEGLAEAVHLESLKADERLQAVTTHSSTWSRSRGTLRREPMRGWISLWRLI